MPSQVIVPHRPGPLVDAPPLDGGRADDAQESVIGPPEIVLSAIGGVLLAAVPAAGLPGWLSVVAVACLALGLALPAYAALLRARRRRAERRRGRLLAGGMPLDVSGAPVLRLVAAYRRLERTAGPGLALDAAHLALAEVAGLLDGRAPEGPEEDYVLCRAEAVSALADRLADGPVTPAEVADADSLARIKALLT